MNWELQRKRMVLDQLISREIRNPQLLNAFSQVPRHLFVPEPQRPRSYTDHPLPIGEGQTISQPYIVALMVEALSLRPKARVLEIGTGSGYCTALLAHLAAQVYSIECIPSLAEGASRALKVLKISNVEIRVGDGTLGWPEEAPFDAILVSASAPAIPVPLQEQLAEEGRLVIPIGSAVTQRLTVVERHQGKLRIREGCGCLFVPLVGAYGWSQTEVNSREVDSK